jgi:hypothetical protein
MFTTGRINCKQRQVVIPFTKGSEAEDEFDSVSNLSSLLHIEEDEIHNTFISRSFGNFRQT